MRRVTHKDDEIALDRTKLESEGVVRDRRTRQTFYSDAGKAADEARDAASEQKRREAEGDRGKIFEHLDNVFLANGRETYRAPRDPSLRPPRAVLGIPDDAPLTRQVIRDAFDEREREVCGGRIVTYSSDVAHLREARYWLLEELAS